MITNSALRKNLSKDNILLDDYQLNQIRSFLVQMATIEHEYSKKKKVHKNDFQNNPTIDISTKTEKFKLQLTA